MPQMARPITSAAPRRNSRTCDALRRRLNAAQSAAPDAVTAITIDRVKSQGVYSIAGVMRMAAMPV